MGRGGTGQGSDFLLHPFCGLIYRLKLPLFSKTDALAVRSGGDEKQERVK